MYKINLKAKNRYMISCPSRKKTHIVVKLIRDTRQLSAFVLFWNHSSDFSRIRTVPFEFMEPKWRINKRFAKTIGTKRKFISKTKTLSSRVVKTICDPNGQITFYNLKVKM